MKSALFLLLLLSISSVLSFECYTCNTNSYRNGPCIDRKSKCENSTSCSMAVMYQGGKAVIRKFCTPPNTPIYQYLMMLPGASMCQNVDFSVFESRKKREVAGERGPPGVSNDHSSLLCVCSTPLCNRGPYSKVLENTMLNNLPKRLIPPLPNFEKELKQEENNLLNSDEAEDMVQQMTEAGF